MKAKSPTRKGSKEGTQRVLIVDDHPFLRVGLSEMLGKEPGISVCGAVGTAEAALQAVEERKPDIVVTDINLPGRNGLELIKDLASLHPGLPVIALSTHEEEVYAERCVRAGARGYVAKSENTDELIIAIRGVLAGGMHLSAKSSARILKSLASGGKLAPVKSVDQLSDRELEVFQWLGRGLSTREIAARLHISDKTVETHRTHVKAKLGLTTAGELIAFAARWVSAGE